MVIKSIVCPSYKYPTKCPYDMNPEGITIHNTANDASAVAEISYMIGNNNQVSFHAAVDDTQIVTGIPFNKNAWHAGDGANGYGNRKTIGIEICYSLSGGSRFLQAEKNAAWYVAYLMKQYGWGFDRISDHRIGTHQNRSGKYCPHRTLDMGLDRFWNMVKEEYYRQTGTNSNTAKLYRVQLGAYKNKGNADKKALELNTKGIDTYIVNIDGYYKVQCGAYANAENARNMAKRLNGMGYATYIAGLEESSKGTKQNGTAYRINTDYPNIRSGASLYSSIVRIAPKGEIIYVIGIENGFYKLSDGTYLKIGFADKV